MLEVAAAYFHFGYCCRRLVVPGVSGDKCCQSAETLRLAHYDFVVDSVDYCTGGTEEKWYCFAVEEKRRSFGTIDRVARKDRHCRRRARKHQKAWHADTGKHMANLKKRLD